MASGTADLPRDLGGAVMQSILGALLTAGYASAVAAAVAAAPNKKEITTGIEAQLQKSFAGAEGVAERYPQYATQITAGAKSSFLDGADWAYGAGIIAILLGVIVYFLFPKREEEKALLARYQAEDSGAAPVTADLGRPAGRAARDTVSGAEAAPVRRWADHRRLHRPAGGRSSWTSSRRP
jgi:hypothetical protein